MRRPGKRVLVGELLAADPDPANPCTARIRRALREVLAQLEAPDLTPPKSSGIINPSIRIDG